MNYHKIFTGLCLITGIMTDPMVHSEETKANTVQTEVYSAKLDETDVQMFIPHDTKVLRGILLHGANYKLSTEDRWAEMCRAMGWAHLALNLEGKGNRGPRLLTGLVEGPKLFAEKSGHKELANLPIAVVGHSAGGMGMSAALNLPERLLTSCISCGWVHDSAKPNAHPEIPYLCILGAIPDDFKMLPGVETNFLPARQAKYPWGLALQWGCAHDFGNSACLFIPWIRAVESFRIPKDWKPLAGAPTLKPMTEADGWLGDRATVESNFASVASFADHKEDKALASWFPSREAAFVWRAMMSKDSPITLEASAKNGSATLSSPKPKSERGLLLNPGLDLVLRIAMTKPTELKQVEFFDGDVSVGIAKAAPWELAWKTPSQGPHSVFAIWTDSTGKLGTTNPALIVIRKYASAETAKEISRPEDNKGPK